MSGRIALLLGRNDDSSLLNYCSTEDQGDKDGLGDCDVRRMRDALERCGFETEVLAPGLDRESDVLQALNERVPVYHGYEQLLFYFSGHGTRLGDELRLMLGNDEYLPARTVITKLHEHGPRSCTVVLDCCYAGSVCNCWPGGTDNVSALLATEANQRAIQLDALKGSLFTHWLCCALSDAKLWRDDLIDERGTLWSDQLVRWIGPKVQESGKRYELSDALVPRPMVHAASGQGHRFPVARVPLHRVPGYPRRLRDALVDALRQTGVGDEQARHSYESCWQREDGGLLPTLKPGEGRDRVLEILFDVDRYYWLGNKLPLPLVGFVAQLCDELNQPPALLRWLEQVRSEICEGGRVAEQHFEQSLRTESDAVTPRRPCLLIQVAPQPESGEHYCVSWDYVDEKGMPVLLGDGPRYCRGPGSPLSAEELPGEVGLAIECLREDPDDADVQLLLPGQLLNDGCLLQQLERVLCFDPDPGFEPPPPQVLADGHLAYDYPLVLRCWERWYGSPRQRKGFGAGKLRTQWSEREACLVASPQSPCLEWIPAQSGQALPDAAARHLATPRAAERPLAFGCRVAPRERDMALLLHKGVAILLWPRGEGNHGDTATQMSTELVDRCASTGIGGLPQALQGHRQYLSAGDPPASCAYNLLWDTPDLPHFDQPDYAHTWSE